MPRLSDASNVSYHFSSHFHPFVQELMRRLVTGSVQGLQDADTEEPPLRRELFTTADYLPTRLVGTKPVAELEFSSGGAYSIYNWELFFHVPMAIAVHLSRNGRYEEAQRWLHYVFDPTDASDGRTPERFWKTAPLRKTVVKSIEEILDNLSTGADPKLREATQSSIRAWQQNPFRPHLVASYRPSAYMVHAVMAYLDNLIAWGDALFRQDTAESVSEATQVYVLAANLLGPRPQQVPASGDVLPQTYNSVKRRLTEADAVENTLHFDDLTVSQASAGSDGIRALDTLASPYFCIPRNEKLHGYWDTVADRLFKIRNSLNLAGAFRRLPLFDPPIDPALLARAAAAGVDVAAGLPEADQAVPLVRFGVLITKAVELCQEVKSLGATLLSAIEKQDGEAFAALRAQHESALLKLGEAIKYAHWQEAIKNREALTASLDIAMARYTYYQQLLGVPEEDITFQEMAALDTSGLNKGQFSSAEPTIESESIDVDIDDSPISDILAAGLKINRYEASELALIEIAQLEQDVAAVDDVFAGLLRAIPLVSIDVKPIGTGAGTAVGGENLAALASSAAALHRGIASRLSHEAGRAARVGGYARRQQEWQFQSNLAAGDVNQITRQLRAAEIREYMAGRDLENHRAQMEQAAEVEAFLAGEASQKTTTAGYYAVMRREARGLYNRAYELALETARKAERALRHELGDAALTPFVQPGYLTGSEGLFAGENLLHDVRRMELAYADLNKREYELTKNVSLLQLAPLELMKLRATGKATFTIPEELFDLDTPGHYFRRIRSVAVSIPCVTGPYTGVACTARLLNSHIRTSAALPNDRYVAEDENDARFSPQRGVDESIVTSSGSNDSGLFETNLRDERLLPFEYRGAAGDWQLELASDPRPFDYDTITDVVLHIRYTARDGGIPLRDAASAHLRELLGAGTAVGSTRLLSARHEFPTAWARFMAATPGAGTESDPRAALVLDLRREHYPFFAGNAGPSELMRVDVIARPVADTPSTLVVARAPVGGSPDGVGTVELTTRENLGGLRFGTLGGPAGQGWGDLPSPVGPLTLYADDNSMADILVALTWKP